MRRVVDTNVPIIANGRGTNASGDCRLAAVEFLNEIARRGTVLLDLGGEIQKEYRRNLRPSGEPGVGDRFFLQVLMEANVERIELPIDQGTGEFQDFPNDDALNSFDADDRKFAALARRANEPVVNATDSDWLEYKTVLNVNGICVEFLCGCDPSIWFD